MYNLGKSRILSMKWENVGVISEKKSYYIYKLGKGRILCIKWEKVGANTGKKSYSMYRLRKCCILDTPQRRWVKN